jgi:hypothetical protein
MSKVAISGIASDYKFGKTVTKIAKENKFCFRRVRKLIHFLLSLAEFENYMGIR